MKFLIDMNLSPRWISFLAERGFTAVHWSTVGQPSAPDSEIFDFAAANDWIVFTHDLDFGMLLATLRTSRPSVIQSAPRTFYRPRLAISWSGQFRPLNPTSKLVLSLPWTRFATAFGCCLSEGIEGRPCMSVPTHLAKIDPSLKPT
jgi:hypothetical protein